MLLGKHGDNPHILLGFRYFFMLPIVFATLHYSYGVGSLWGLLTMKKWIAKNTLATKARRHKGKEYTW